MARSKPRIKENASALPRSSSTTETPRDQYYEGYPAATEAEIQMLLDADKKNGHPPQSLAHERSTRARGTDSSLQG
jgi:hypothetical protein